MKKFMNKPDQIVAESLAGFVAAHEDLVRFDAGARFIRRRELTPGKVALVSGGGAGHEPMHIGFVGRGMLDGACTGHIFTSPTPDQILAAIKECDTGAGCLLVVKNYDGDVMNFEMAAEMAVAAGHRVETVVVNDDVAAYGAARSSGRRGVAGTMIVEKMLGAAAEAGMDLSELKTLGERVVSDTHTMGVALKGATVPDTARATFTLAADEMEIGVGIHGEPGRSRQTVADANRIAELVCDGILAEADPHARRPALLLVNGFGGTPVSELYLVYNAVRSCLALRGIEVARSLVGTYVTSLDMAGMSATVAFLDAERIALWDAPVATAAVRWGL